MPLLFQDFESLFVPWMIEFCPGFCQLVPCLLPPLLTWSLPIHFILCTFRMLLFDHTIFQHPFLCKFIFEDINGLCHPVLSPF